MLGVVSDFIPAGQWSLEGSGRMAEVGQEGTPRPTLFTTLLIIYDCASRVVPLGALEWLIVEDRITTCRAEVKDLSTFPTSTGHLSTRWFLAFSLRRLRAIVRCGLGKFGNYIARIILSFRNEKDRKSVV